MPYIFLVNQRNLPICVSNQLLGVPASSRALSQITNVHDGGQVFIYVFGKKELYGVFRARGEVFQERFPGRGPWLGSRWDEQNGYYPYRLDMRTEQALAKPLNLDVLEGLGIRENRFKGMSVVYITEAEAQRLTQALETANADATQQLTAPSHLFTSRRMGVQLPGPSDSEEARLQPIVQHNITRLESDLRVVASYVNLRQELGYRGEVDILAQSSREYVVIEVKVGALPETIWNQVFTYTNVVRQMYNTNTRAMIVCEEVDRRTHFAYPEIRRRLANTMDLRIFRFRDLDSVNATVRFEEVPF